MRIRHRVRVNVRGPDGEERVLETSRGALRSRILRQIAGDRYSVLVLTPAGSKVDSIEVHEMNDTKTLEEKKHDEQI